MSSASGFVFGRKLKLSQVDSLRSPLRDSLRLSVSLRSAHRVPFSCTFAVALDPGGSMGGLAILCCSPPTARSLLGQRQRLLATRKLSWLVPTALVLAINASCSPLGRLRMTRFRLRGSTLFPGRIFTCWAPSQSFHFSCSSVLCFCFFFFSIFCFLSVCVYLGAMTPFLPPFLPFLAFLYAVSRFFRFLCDPQFHFQTVAVREKFFRSDLELRNLG